MTTDIYNQVTFWMENFGLLGDAFRYYPDQTDLNRFFECKHVGKNKRYFPTRAHPRIELWDVKFRVRVILVSAPILTDRAGYYP